MSEQLQTGVGNLPPRKNAQYVAVRACRECGTFAWMRKHQVLCSIACQGRVRSIEADPLEAFLWRRTSPEPNTGCWLWTGAVNEGGYGTINHPRRGGKFAHRVAFAHWRGPIPAGMDLDHLCRVRCCVNPEHLEPVTRQENIRRGRVGEATAERQRGRTHCKRGHEFTPANTIIRKNGVRNCRACRVVRGEISGRFRCQ